MRPMLKNLPLMICVVSLAGCVNPFGKEGYLRDKSGDYTEEKTTEPARVPEGLNARLLESTLVIPPITRTDVELQQEFEVPRPDQRLTRKVGGETYSIEREGDDVWILATKSPSEIWPRLEAFFETSKLALTSQNAKKGQLETDWVNFGSDDEHGVVFRTIGKMVGVSDLDPMEDRFQIDVRRGVKEGTAEIHIQHKGRPPVESGKKAEPEPAQWDNLGERSQRMNQALASDILIFLAEDKDGGSVSYLAQDLDIGANTELTQDGNGTPLLSIKGLPYGRSWAAIGDALESAGVVVVDKNRSAGIYYLSTDPKTISKPKKEPGFFSRLFGSDKKEETLNQETLNLRVSQFPDSIQVSVEKDSATSADKDESQKLLELVRDNLK